MRRETKVGAFWKLGMGIGVALAASVGAQTSPYLDPDLFHEYIQRGRVLSGQVARPDNQLQGKGTVVAHVTEDSLYLAGLIEGCTLPICGGVCSGMPTATVAMPLAARADGKFPVLGLLRASRSGPRDFQATVALLTADGLLRKEEISVVNGALSSRKAATPLRPTADIIARTRAIADVQFSGPTTDASFLLLGTQGLLVRIDEKGDALKETLLVAGLNADFTAYGEGYVGTLSGAVFRVNSVFAPPYLVQHGPVGGPPVVRISSRVAVLADGDFHVLRSGFWSGRRQGRPGLVGVHPVPTDSGTLATLFLPTDTEYRDLGDVSTTLLYQGPGGVFVAPPQTPIRYEGGPAQTFRVAFRDPDRNALPPEIHLIVGGDRVYNDFQQAVQADPALGCLRTGKCIPGEETVLGITARQDSLLLSMPILEGVRGVDPMCRVPNFQGKPGRFEAAYPWRRGDRLHVRVGSRYLDLSFGTPAGVALPGASLPPGPGRARPLEGWRFRAEAPTGAVYGADGRAVTHLLP